MTGFVLASLLYPYGRGAVRAWMVYRENGFDRVEAALNAVFWPVDLLEQLAARAAKFRVDNLMNRLRGEE